MQGVARYRAEEAWDAHGWTGWLVVAPDGRVVREIPGVGPDRWVSALEGAKALAAELNAGGARGERARRGGAGRRRSARGGSGAQGTKGQGHGFARGPDADGTGPAG